MKRAVALVALSLSLGCGSSERTSASSGDAAVDAVASADALVEATTDGPVVYCSSVCGAVDASDGQGGVTRCQAGQICGETGGISGFLCCDQQARPTCAPGNPSPGTPCP